MLAEWALAGEIALRQGPVDDDHPRRARDVALVEDAPGEDRDAQRLEIARRGDPLLGEGLFAARILAPLDAEPPVGPSAERDVADQGCGLDARERLRALTHLAEEGGLLLRLRVAAGRQEEIAADHALGVETLVDGEQPVEAAQEQAGADEQGERERHLGHDERAAQALAGRPAGGPARAFFHHLGQVRPRGAQRREEAEEQPREEGQGQRETQDLRIDRGLGEPRHAARAERAQTRHAGPGHEHTAAAANERQQQALDQQLPHEAPARRAERRPDGDLPPPHRRAREQQVRHVGARDEEHHGHGAGEGDEEGPRIADHEALQGEETDVLVRPHGLLQPASEGHGPLLGLREAKPGAQAPEHVQELHVARRVFSRVEPQVHP